MVCSSLYEYFWILLGNNLSPNDPIEQTILRLANLNAVCKEMNAGNYVHLDNSLLTLNIAERWRLYVPEHLIEEYDIHIFLQEFMKGHQPRQKMKLVVLGKGRIGKTTLVHFLKHRNKSYAAVSMLLRVEHLLTFY